MNERSYGIIYFILTRVTLGIWLVWDMIILTDMCLNLLRMKSQQLEGVAVSVTLCA